MPVAVAPVDRQADAVASSSARSAAISVADLAVDRADTAEVIVVLGDLLEPLAGDVAAPGDVLEERHHVVQALGPAEADDQDRVEVRLGEADTKPSAGALSAEAFISSRVAARVGRRSAAPTERSSGAFQRLAEPL